MKKIEKWYHTKDTFTEKENNKINKLIDSYELDTDDIKEYIMYYIYSRLEEEYKDKWNNEEIWAFTDEHTNNAETGKENYANLLEYLHKLEDDKLEDLPF